MPAITEDRMLTGYRKCGVGVVLTFLTAGLGIAADAAAQEQEKATSRAHDAGWKANVITALFPEKVKRKLRVKIEADQLVCRSGGSDVLEIPLQAVIGITRDRAKDYPATEFLLGVAMMPTGEQHTFASKEYRHQMVARGTLAVISLAGLLFPKHKEVVLVSWRDQFGEHDAEFRMSRADGQKMLYELEQESGLQARDLEKECYRQAVIVELRHRMEDCRLPADAGLTEIRANRRLLFPDKVMEELPVIRPERTRAIGCRDFTRPEVACESALPLRLLLGPGRSLPAGTLHGYWAELGRPVAW